MDLTPHILHPHVKGETLPQQSGNENEDALFALTDEIAEQEDVPLDYAYRLAQLRLAMVKEAPVCS